MNDFKYTSFVISIIGLCCGISSIISLFNKDYNIIFVTLILTFPGFIVGLFFDLLFSTLKGSDKE